MFSPRAAEKGDSNALEYRTSTIPLLLEAFSLAVEKEFSSAKFLVDAQVLYAKRRYTGQSFSTRKTA